ncbi:sugar kinase [Lacrimispora sp. NSJ-141]|uniref:Sugar kinase n=1 Tax=Lientehia hominis TaxID=2897778 RepID=A0AAP2RK44_9FIRM|nr:sugar kinase [Lientehia hominis]MCD2493679.1 sugar kinase [Lientehia hominis]
MAKIITFGEIMLRLAPPDGQRFLQSPELEATFGGGEANVAVSLANFGEDVAFLTALPEDDIGQAAVNSLRYFGVDTTKILRQGERVGIYYAEKGQSQRPSKVIYDRKYSSISMVKQEDFHWDEIFEGTEWFHFTGITPALTPEMHAVCLDACMAARERGITISCDLNYRKKLWTTEEAFETMTKLASYVDVCIANEEDAEKVLGISAKDTDVDSGKLSYEGYKAVASEISERYGCKQVAVTLRTSLSANDNRWAAMLYSDGGYYFSKTYDIHIWDRVGGGDSFGGGLIYAIRRGMDSQSAIEFAAAASCLKHSIQGDFNRVSVEEVNSLMKDGGSGRVQR